MGRKQKPNRISVGKFSFNLDSYNDRVDTTGNCWTWTGARHVQGYGFVSIRNDQTNASAMTVAHRVALMIELDRELTRDEYIVHKCDNPLCVRPDHLKITDKLGKSQHNIALGKYANRGKTNTGMKKQNRKYRYTDDEMRWLRIATTTEIAEKYNISKSDAGKLRWEMRRSYKWLD